MNRLVALSAAVALVLFVAACGGDGGGGGGDDGDGPAPPEAQQSIEEFAAEFEKAAASAAQGDCDAYAGLYPEGTPLPPCDDLQGDVGNVSVAESAEYGTGGTFDYTGPEFAQGDNVAAQVGLDTEGEWRFNGSFTTDAPSVGTEPESTERFDQTINDWLDALRNEDCDLYFKVALTPGLSKADACKEQFEGASSGYIPVLQDNPDAEPESLGGNAYMQVYGLSLPEQYFTIEVSASPTPEDKMLVAAVFVGADEAADEGAPAE